ncbi:nuclear transport factor 2 family protein [Nocardioides sp. LMS-CY]|uniref:nuclear transport factor 2 family protein n=1 Tax=Nocardioides sp. (strain LMS-CY) TaxID=2840457 RepID=UPI001C0083EC|nr:nuclear transport factor 2 family protein [Nocardioides sp. LMS-CY]QWF22629.1 nuclear transport factor 2 family protein [Nocardioides sp. LMS-CY]
MDHGSAQQWLDRYVAAWLSYDPAEIGALFADDVSHRYHPYDEPIVGRTAVVASWLGADASGVASTRDEPGTYEATYAPVAVDGNVVVARGSTSYRRHPGGPVHQVYDNCFLIRFDDRGRCREFTEFYVLRPS